MRGSSISLAVLLLLAGCGHDTTEPTPLEPTPRHNLAPSADTTMSGRVTYDRITIPEGITVTASGDLALFARGRIEIKGVLAGISSTRLMLHSDSTLVVEGVVRNSAAGAPESPKELILVGKRGVTLDGASVQSSARVVVVNDSLDQEGSLDGPSGTAGITVNGATLQIFPLVARGGADGAIGGAGANGGSIVVLARGPVALIGTSTFRAQDGGNGGDGSHEDATAASARGGDGGDGGAVILRSRTRIELATASSSMAQSGNGGAGGRADASGLPSSSGNAAASATAIGGNGGLGGAIGFEATTSILLHGAMTLNVGAGGSGGVGNALGADGHAASDGTPQEGGDASATGGVGGRSIDPTRTLTTTDGGSFAVIGGAGGNGGYVAAIPGRGGNGGANGRAGAPGGNALARGGDGGACDALSVGERIAAGGNGGSVLVQGGRGGEGFAACGMSDQSGGMGGLGGAVDAEDGEGAAGTPTGEAGGISLVQCANGGNGGRGTPPGTGGAGGERLVQAFGTITETAPVFSSGAIGAECGSGSGACCSLGGSCTIVTATLCEQTGGTYRGDGTNCEVVNCDLLTGACCFLDGSCQIRAEELCQLSEGDFLGGGSDCDPNPCAGKGQHAR